MATLKEQYETAATEYVSRKQSAQARTVRREWASGNLYDLRPYWFLRNQFPTGRLLKSEPMKKSGVCEYGFDSAGRLVLNREGTSIPGQFYEEFCEYGSAGAQAVRYTESEPKVPLSVSAYFLDGDRITEFESYAMRGWRKEKYQYSDSRLTAVGVEAASHGQPAQSYREEIIYDELGEVREIRRVLGNGEVRAIYHAKGNGRSLDEVALIYENKAIDRIPSVVATLSVPEPIYALVLAYDCESDQIFPPVLGLGLESERQQWMRQYGQKAKEFIWNPAEWSFFDRPELSIRDEEYQRTSEALSRLIKETGDCHAVARILNKVALRLMKISWQEKLHRTDDFLVYAVDLELVDLQKNLKAVAGTALQKLKKNGYL